MTTENATDDREQSDLELLWLTLGRLALAGQVPLSVARLACAILMVVASYRRHGGVKTYVADELRTSRRVVREMLEYWSEPGSIRELLEELRSKRKRDAGA